MEVYVGLKRIIHFGMRTAYFTAVFAYLMPMIENKFVKLEDQLTESPAESGLIPALILEALDQSTLVEITTFRRKSYVGWIIRGPGISKQERMSDVAVLPLYSGYRNRLDLTLLLTTDYSRVHDKILNAENAEKADISEEDEGLRESIEKIGYQMSVVLPLDDIASIRPYIPSLTDAFDEI